ncbi:hypothetical protein AA313_de0205325 [Arthrobotrys entomopaga]|nr:hypothetical protein AA313_de0205325 [Arthrobotrys entomopaga]
MKNRSAHRVQGRISKVMKFCKHTYLLSLFDRNKSTNNQSTRNSKWGLRRPLKSEKKAWWSNSSLILVEGKREMNNIKKQLISTSMSMEAESRWNADPRDARPTRLPERTSCKKAVLSVIASSIRCVHNLEDFMS